MFFNYLSRGAFGLATAGLGVLIASSPSMAYTSAPQTYHVQSTWSNVGPTPHFSGVDMKLHKLFVSNLANGTVTVLNSQTGQYLGTIKIGGTLHTVMVDQQTNTVYVTDIQRGLLDVINAKTDQVTDEIAVGGHPHGLAVSNRLHEAFVSNVSLSEIEVINLKTNRVIKTIPVGPNPWGVTVNPVTDTIYAANTGINPFAAQSDQQLNPQGDSVTVINGHTFTVEATIPVGPHPWNLIADPVNNETYVGVSGAHEVAVLAHNHVVQDITVGQSPHGLALDLPAHRLFVNDSLSNAVSVVNTRTNQVVQTLPTGQQPQGVSVDSHTGTVYIMNQASQTATILQSLPRTAHR
ncbi:YncE family protein [Sulfobacillus thermosulfidooxidans]|uniref:YncE family protein n=1 Tax=Sulfobacillus thermosulfidooxidans TaxID=28034 RepID=UPI0003024A00|nr:YncE family protein [Sulfobacillus thermosulfidooxidans]